MREYLRAAQRLLQLNRAVEVEKDYALAMMFPAIHSRLWKATYRAVLLTRLSRWNRLSTSLKRLRSMEGNFKEASQFVAHTLPVKDMKDYLRVCLDVYFLMMV